MAETVASRDQSPSGHPRAVSGKPEQRLRRLHRALRVRWPRIQASSDAVSWLIAVPAGAVVRYDFDIVEVHWRHSLLLGAMAALVFVATGWARGLYSRRWRYASFDELGALVMTGAWTTLLVFAANLWLFDRLVPAGAPLAAGPIALLGAFGVRYAGRVLYEQFRRPNLRVGTPVLVFGAGNAGAQLVKSLMSDPTSTYVPVGLLDDNPAKQNLSISGVKVLGTRHDLASAAQATKAKLVVLALPSAEGTVIRELVRLAGEAGLRTNTLPSVRELLTGEVGVGDIREITEADLLGRRQIDTDLTAIAGYVTGKRVLVTGAGGSIGSELCRQLHTYGPAELVMLDRDESALHAVELSIEGRALLLSRNLVVADIRDPARLREVFAEHRPEVVFHAAALKHLPLLELHPVEGVKTNIYGTQHLLDAAIEFGVERFVNISTDKAARPESVLGRTKRIAERLTAAAGEQTGRPYLSVRFGNVLGSRGSVVPAFQAMIAAGGPVTVTDKDVTRYFMTIPEAVQLVIQAGAIGQRGEVLILDMGQPVRIVDVAQRLIEASGKRVEIVFTGLRAGEKLHEDLVDPEEVGVRREHPLITHAAVPPLPWADVASLLVQGASAGELVRLTTATPTATYRAVLDR